ncbi:SDR family NAD(P)-dependent oxidoreductase [Dactylosporangium sp. CA-233914]|uniref:SDR family NAD(P)-dependent oxidoreductase n=1 Tax=Dactylosporangium sp. CA-233914 TaxID=3239934 RepID=UPI003D90FCFC
MRSALVTGASRGIGHGIALQLARDGFGLTVTSRSRADLAKAAEELVAAGAPEVTHIAADLADRESLLAVADLHRECFGSMDALVLSGGVGTAGALHSIDLRRADKTVAVNFMSAVTLVRAALPALRAAGAASPHGARVIVLSSITGAYAEPGLAVYGATKAALLSLAESLSAEEGHNGVLATAVAPAYVATDMSAWAADRIDPSAMIPVSDVVAVVRMLLQLGRNTSIPRIVLARSGTSGYQA